MRSVFKWIQSIGNLSNLAAMLHNSSSIFESSKTYCIRYQISGDKDQILCNLTENPCILTIICVICIQLVSVIYNQNGKAMY